MPAVYDTLWARQANNNSTGTTYVSFGNPGLNSTDPQTQYGTEVNVDSSANGKSIIAMIVATCEHSIIINHAAAKLIKTSCSLALITNPVKASSSA